MTEKLKDYQVLDVLCGGTFYKVKHKISNNIFAWKAYDCTAYSDEQIQNIVNEVKTISKVLSGNLLRYYDTILHNASKTLYFVLEYNSWQSVQELITVCKATDKYFSESFIWYLLLELARACKVVENLNFAVIRKCITPTTIYVDGSGEVRVDCFQLQTTITGSSDLMQQIGDVIHTLCYRPETIENKIKEFHYSDDLRDVVSFLTDERSSGLRPEVVIYHPTILSNLETNSKPKHLAEILVSSEYSQQKSELNKCDSEKFVEKCRTIKRLPRTQFNIIDSPVYSNICPKQKPNKEIEGSNLEKSSLSPTLQALALELPGYVPRCRKPYSEVIGTFNNAQKVSEETLSHQWMSRLIALREREESLNKRERKLVVKEIINSPATKLVSNEDSDVCESNGITLPPVVASAEKNRWKSRRRRRRSGSVRTRARRQSYSYEDLDSSLSADTGDGSIIVTATKFTTENMPRRNIFPDMPSKKVHFTPVNPFIGSDESVTLTFYELDNLDNVENQSSTQSEKAVKDITKFKYLDLENAISEKRAATQWSHSSPSKQAKVFADITNHSSLRKTPSKSSLTSRSSITSRCSMMSARSHWSMDSSSGKVSEGYVSDRTRSSMRQCFPQTPTAPPELKKTKSRKSLIHFKTPFKFKSSTKV
ncbi:unnamed protein product [Parnassius mnemosyne]|uniref:non-specific serine/threonine protein kinase n=1 Tax=Parnassius mnemosyne TaxID=213953 RepID=A0AAV1L5Q3_9NEOP